ncbi:hypothetical protein C8Q73DRAFT_691846 [Cubamyces lactineus]|nr:hypothetical protein C8Q73DRAFT_691846 [Cubamyces lactineus]
MDMDRDAHNIRLQLPPTLHGWRVPEAPWISEEAIWEKVRGMFDREGISLWHRTSPDFTKAPRGEMVLSSGFAYILAHRSEEWRGMTKFFNSYNGTCHGATTADGHSAVVRIISIGNEGKSHLNVLRKIAQGSVSLLTHNHTIPLWREVFFEDMVFGVFPFIGERLHVCYASWLKNSVGDIINMVLQALEALSFVHEMNIAHRDADKANFLVQWHPESLATMQLPQGAFCNDADYGEGYLGKEYLRDVAPEVKSGQPYDAYKADVWQFAASFADFQSTVPEIDEIMEAMRDPNPGSRLSSLEARDRLAAAFHSIPPKSLLIPPTVL